MNTTFICRIFNATLKDVDEFRCFFTNAAANAFYYNFGYLCLALSFLIVIISIFGGIKENYRWFILNQAIWDIIISYIFSCDNDTKKFGTIFDRNITTCFYVFGDQFSMFGVIPDLIRSTSDNNQHSALFLLTLSRFLALYTIRIYSRFFKKTKTVLFIILIFNIILFPLSGNGILYRLTNLRLTDIMNESLKKGIPFPLISQLQNNDELQKIYHKISIILEYTVASTRCIFLILIIFMAFMLILKLIKQSAFQWKHNRSDFYTSARISIVIFLESLINFFVFLISFIPVFKSLILAEIFHYKILLPTGKIMQGTASYKNAIDLSFIPLWLDGDFGFTDAIPYQFIVQLRVFIEAILILLVMAGYREVLRKIFQHLYFAIRHPKKAFKKTKNFFNQSSSRVIVLSSNSRTR